MKKTILSLIILIALSINTSFGQDESENHHNVDISLGFGEKAFSPALSYTYYFALGKKGKFNIGPGIRFFGAEGKDWRLAEENAPDDNYGDGDLDANAFFSENNRMLGLNLGLFLKYEITDFLEVGLNMDVIGLSFGSRQDGTFVNTATGEVTPVTDIGYVNPNTLFNNGNVSNDMIWIGYRFKEKFLVRAGFNFTGLMYEIPEDKLPTGVDIENYERVLSLGFIGFSYKF